ncbi:hypothetical protein Bca101_099661 [Brassica carinata]
MMGSSQVIRDSSIHVLPFVLIVSLGHIPFSFTCGYSSSTLAIILRISVQMYLRYLTNPLFLNLFPVFNHIYKLSQWPLQFL